VLPAFPCSELGQCTEQPGRSSDPYMGQGIVFRRLRESTEPLGISIGRLGTC
jgi:hypothetical protein